MLESMNTEEPVELQVFIEPGCESCERARAMANEIDDDYPRLAVRVVDIAQTPVERDDVFAVPTFVLGDRLLSLGNPQRSLLRDKIESLLRQRGLL